MAGAIAVSASPGFRTVLVAAAATIVRVLHARQIEVLLPVGTFFLEGQGTIADFDPSCGFVWAEAGIFHIPEVFAFGNGAFAQGLVFDSFQKCLPALLFHTGSYQISHMCILR